MAFKKKQAFEQGEIAGFWNREGKLQGFLTGQSDKGLSGFFVFKISKGKVKVLSEDKTETKIAKAGDFVAVSKTRTLAMCLDGEPRGSEVRLTSKGKMVHPKNKGHHIWDIDVEVDSDKEALDRYQSTLSTATGSAGDGDDDIPF